MNKPDPIINEGDHVLFIGNSKVGSEGGLHHHFRRTVIKADPPLSISTDWPAMYGANTLGDMYTAEVEERIRTGSDQIIIVSDGSDSSMHVFADLIYAAGKQIVIYSTWADNPFLRNNNWLDFQKITKMNVERVKRFEDETGIPAVPCGLIYYDLLADPVKFEGLREDYLFVPGSSVQNDLGTLVNVSAIYAVLTGRSPVGLSFWNPFPEELITAIQKRVWKIVKAWKAGKVKFPRMPDKQDVGSKMEHSIDPEPPLWNPLLKDGDRIYYVGNSYIGTEGGLENHFQRMVAGMNPPLNIEQTSDIFWGQGLNRMFTDEVIENIRTRYNDVVVVTSGPVEFLNKFHEVITEANSKMMVHMTWGLNPVINEGGLEKYREQTVRIVEAMSTFEKETGVPVAPCGLVFYDLIVDPPSIQDLRLDWVYMVENIHQNHIGTMANAATHYAVLTGRSPVGLEMWDPYPPELVEEVQQRAWKIVKDWKSGKIEIKPLPE